MGRRKRRAWSCRRAGDRSCLHECQRLKSFDGWRGRLTVEKTQPSAIMILLPIKDIIELRRLVVQQPVLALPSGEILQSLQNSDVRDMASLVKRFISASIMILAEVNRQVQRDVREPFLPGAANAIALFASIATPEDLKWLTAIRRLPLCNGVDFIKRPRLLRHVGLPLSRRADDGERQCGGLDSHCIDQARRYGFEKYQMRRSRSFTPIDILYTTAHLSSCGNPIVLP